MASGHFCLKWNNFHNSIVSAFESLQSSEELVDVTLMCEGRNVRAHKVILSACSPYFRNLFKETPCQHPIIILKDVLHCDLVAILQFMYQGEVLVDQDGLTSFLKTAELLQVSGLAGGNAPTTTSVPEQPIIPTKTVPIPVIDTVNTITNPNSPASPKTIVNKHRIDLMPLDSIENEDVILTKDDDDNETNKFKTDIVEPMQSCSYSTDDVIIKTESTDEADFTDMDYSVLGHDSIDDPGPTNEEQSILERSLKAQGMSPHSTKVYAMDYAPLDTKTLLPINKNNIDGVKRKTKITLNDNQYVKKITKTIQPKNDLIKSTIISGPGEQIHTGKSDHHGALFGNCPHCNKPYSNQSALKYHVRLVHSDMLNMFCCHLCPESFEYRESYKAHMWDKHSVRN